MEYVYGTSVIGGVERENLKIVGGPALREGEYLTTVREYDDSSITDRCRIRTSPCHTCCHRNHFMQMDTYTFHDSTGIHHQFRRPPYQVIFIHRDIFFIGCQMNPRLHTLSHIQLIIHTDCLHDHADLMVSVFPFS